MIKLSSLKPGDIVYDCHRHKCGNTTISELGVWTVKVVSVDVPGNRVKASWNGNPARDYSGPTLSWRRWPPEWVKPAFREAYCCICWKPQSEGHRVECEHPKAVKAIEKASK